jgi:hypothetical protein
MVLLLGSHPALAAGFQLGNGAHGRYGTPHTFIGGSVAGWETYRKKLDWHAPLFPSVTATAPPEGGIHFSENRFGCPGNVCTWQGPGVFLGASKSLRSDALGNVRLKSCVADTGDVGEVDLRFGFAEDGAGSGAPLSAFVDHGGGEDSYIDLYRGDWGVDGLELHVPVVNSGATWQLNGIGATLVAARSVIEEGVRNDYGPDVVVQGATPFDGGYDLGVPSNVPLAVSFSLDQQGGKTTLVGKLGTTTLRWLVDDGKTKFGLTDPGNQMDFVGYDDGSLEPSSLVPVMYIALRYGEPAIEPLPSVSIDLQLDDPMASSYNSACGCQTSGGLGCGLLALALVYSRRNALKLCRSATRERRTQPGNATSGAMDSITTSMSRS